MFYSFLLFQKYENTILHLFSFIAFPYFMHQYKQSQNTNDYER